MLRPPGTTRPSVTSRLCPLPSAALPRACHGAGWGGGVCEPLCPLGLLGGGACTGPSPTPASSPRDDWSGAFLPFIHCRGVVFTVSIRLWGLFSSGVRSLGQAWTWSSVTGLLPLRTAWPLTSVRGHGGALDRALRVKQPCAPGAAGRRASCSGGGGVSRLTQPPGRRACAASEAALPLNGRRAAALPSSRSRVWGWN